MQSQVWNIDQTEEKKSQRNMHIPRRSDVSKGGLSMICPREGSEDLPSPPLEVEGDLFLFLVGAFEVDEGATGRTVGDALTDRFEPRGTTSADQVCFPIVLP